MRGRRLDGPELTWLQGVTGQPSNTIYNCLGDRDTLDRMNLKSFVYGVLSPQTGELSTEHAASFTTTLATLMGAGTQAPFDLPIFSTGLVNLIGWMEDDGNGGSIAANALRQMYESILQPSATAP